MLLGIDLGTQSVKALLLATDGTVLAEASSPYPVHAPQIGWAESDPEDWWSATAIAVKQAVGAHSSQVQAIGLSGQMHGVVLSDEAATPLRRAVLWADSRTREFLAVYHSLAPSLLERLANPITTGMAGPTLLWLKTHEPETYAAAKWALQPKDWLRFRLTGLAAAEPSDASGTLLYDVLSDAWAVDVLDVLRLRVDQLAPVMPSGQVSGRLTQQAAQHLGLRESVPVVAGAADTAAAALGTGLLEPGMIQLTVGSGAQLVTPLAEPVLKPSANTHLYRAALPNQWYRLAAIQNAGLALEWVRAILGLGWPEVYELAFSVPAGCEGLTFLPYLTGERTPHLDPQARGAWVGLGLHHTRSHLMRAALEGVAFAIRQGLDAIADTAQLPDIIRLAGGGTLAPQWRQLLADVLGVRLASLEISAASARGAAILAGIGLGIYNADSILVLAPPTTEVTIPNTSPPELEEAWSRYSSLYPSLHHWANLNSNPHSPAEL